MERNGKPFFGICGEFHYSRYPQSCWEAEILKMKAGGINIISTYIFWNHHEEDENIFIWEEDKNLRSFISLCAKNDIYLILRIGPFCHGEVRNGGLPDWLYGRPFNVRSNDEGYLFYAKRFIEEIGKQISGLMYKDNGPVIGVQIENEHMHASPPWEFMVMKEYEWLGNGHDGAEHIKVLKKYAIEACMEVPIYTCTGWGGASFIEDETLPIYGGYSFCPWVLDKSSEHEPTNEYLIQSFHDNNSKCVEFNPTYPREKYPYACCELGGGMACWYKYRFKVEPESVEAATIVRIAGGCNFIGYYMFHDGTNPIGKHGYLNERVVPKISYEFQAPIGEYGQIRDSYKILKPILYFLNDFEETLCPMATALPGEAASITPTDADTLRYAVRHKDGSGFIFLVNYQDHFKMKDMENITLELNLQEEKIVIPKEKGFTLKKNVSAILPFNMEMDGIILKYSTTQLVTYIQEDEMKTYFFFAPDGIKSEYCFQGSNIETLEVQSGTVKKNGDFIYATVKPGKDCIITLKSHGGSSLRINTLTRKESLGLWKFNLWGRDRVILSDADITLRDGQMEASRIENEDLSFSIFPILESELVTKCGKLKGSTDGIFETFNNVLPKKEIKLEVKKVCDAKVVVCFPLNAFNEENEVFLRIDYIGNIGNAFIDGKLISDNFFNGNVWEIGLKRFYSSKLLEKEMYFHVIPYIKGSEVIFDSEIKFGHSFSENQTAEIHSICAVPEYKVLINKL